MHETLLLLRQNSIQVFILALLTISIAVTEKKKINQNERA